MLSKARVLSGRQKARVAKLAPQMAEALTVAEDFTQAYVYAGTGRQALAVPILQHYRVKSLDELSQLVCVKRQKVLRELGGIVHG